MNRHLAPLAIALAASALAAPAAVASNAVPTLEARALLAADASAPAPFPGVPNADPAPAPGARQPVGGFSALLDAPGRDVYWAMPDNGFGTKANSRSFLLSLTTTVFSQRSTGWFSARPRKADAGGPTSLHLLHSTAFDGVPTSTPPQTS